MVCQALLQRTSRVKLPVFDHLSINEPQFLEKIMLDILQTDIGVYVYMGYLSVEHNETFSQNGHLLPSGLR